MITIQRQGSSLTPFAKSDMEKIERLKENVNYEIKVTKIRCPRIHNRFMAMLRAVLYNLPEDIEKQYPTVEAILDELKFQTGHKTEHRTLGGKITYIPNSISFANMDEVEFTKFRDESRDVIIRYFLKGVNKTELEEFINEYM